MEQIRRVGANELRPPAPADGQPRVDPLKGISDLRGRIEMVIDDAGDARWAVGVLVGPGAGPEAGPLAKATPAAHEPGVRAERTGFAGGAWWLALVVFGALRWRRADA